MRVIESAGFYFPDSLGGTEVYVNSLAKQLQNSGINCVIAAPIQSDQPSHYLYEGIEVFRYPVPECLRLDEVQSRVPLRYFGVFEAWVRGQCADVYHQHSLTTGCGLWHLEAAKRLGLKTAITVHVAGNVCMRGTMLYEGATACDGEIFPRRCASCWLQSKGLPAAIAQRVAAFPERLAPLMGLPKLGPALAAQALATTYRKNLMATFAAADRVIAPCDWLRDTLLANGVPDGKIVLNRQGVTNAAKRRKLNGVSNSKMLRFGYLGRWDPVKGAHLLVEVFKLLPETLPAKLVLCGVARTAEEREYYRKVLQLTDGNHRIQFWPDNLADRVGRFLDSVDILLVPSQWLETGPLVVLEAFAAGLPVIASDLGGIKELVSHERDGILVAHNDRTAWVAAIVRLATQRELVERLSMNIGSVRSMSEVAHDMAMLYRDISVTETDAA